MDYAIEESEMSSGDSVYFKIILLTVKNFNQCFYEAMDIGGEVIGIESNGLFWRGNTYRKVK